MTDRLDATRLREVVTYDPETGKFAWRTTLGGHVKAGRRAGSHQQDGYFRVRIDGRLYLAHRLAWLYMTGEWPNGSIDHANGVPGDDHWKNLRVATCSQNQANSRRQKNNTSGHKGVDWDPKNNRWRARIHVEGRQLTLGRYDTLEEAASSYMQAAARLFGEFARFE